MFQINWEHSGEVAYTNSGKLRFTTMPFGNAEGEMGPMMVIVREMKPKEEREMEELFSQHPYKEGWEENEDLNAIFQDADEVDGDGWFRRVERDDSGEYPKYVYETDKGFMNEDCCLLWISDIVKPFIETRGGGAHGGKSLLWWDPAKAHCTVKVKAALDLLQVICIFIPASLTYRYQLVDVVFAATFKSYYVGSWRAWFTKQLLKAYNSEEGAYRPKSLNYIKPSISLCVVWAQLAYDKIKQKKAMLKKKAAELYMAGEDIEMAALMNDHYAGKFKSSYNPKPWATK